VDNASNEGARKFIFFIFSLNFIFLGVCQKLEQRGLFLSTAEQQVILISVALRRRSSKKARRS